MIVSKKIFYFVLFVLSYFGLQKIENLTDVANYSYATVGKLLPLLDFNKHFYILTCVINPSRNPNIMDYFINSPDRKSSFNSSKMADILITLFGEGCYDGVSCYLHTYDALKLTCVSVVRYAFAEAGHDFYYIWPVIPGIIGNGYLTSKLFLLPYINDHGFLSILDHYFDTKFEEDATFISLFVRFLATFDCYGTVDVDYIRYYNLSIYEHINNDDELPGNGVEYLKRLQRCIRNIQENYENYTATYDYENECPVQSFFFFNFLRYT